MILFQVVSCVAVVIVATYTAGIRVVELLDIALVVLVLEAGRQLARAQGATLRHCDSVVS